MLGIEFYNSNGDHIGAHASSKNSSGLELIKVENVVPPAGTKTVCLYFIVQGGGHVAMICPMLNQGNKAAAFVPDNATDAQVQHAYSAINQANDRINLRVEKNGVINAINISPEGTQIYGNKLHITSTTYIDDAIIKDAMISNLSASKLTAGSIDATKINVYNINGSNIVANSITADKIQAGSMLIALNSTLQTMRIGTDGLYTTDNKGDGVGRIHTNAIIGHPDIYGLNFDLDDTGDYMAWGAKNRGDPDGTYAIKLGWYRSDTANTIGDAKGFVFSDQVTFNNDIQVTGAFQNLIFGVTKFNGDTHYPYFGAPGLKAGLAYGSNETYLIANGKYADMTKVIFALQGIGTAYIPTKLSSDGKISQYVRVNL